MWDNYPDIQDEMKSIEAFIRKSIASRNRLLSQICSELVDAGGKRLRPAFVVICSRFGKADRKKIMKAAGAMEILHTATLVHDDIIDRSDVRRGKMTVSHRYGTEMGIYVGDFLFTKAVLMLSGGIATDKLEIVARGIKMICEGEVDQYQDRYNIHTTTVSYLKRIHRKTAILFGAACGLGAALSKCPVKTVKQLTRFGICFGMAFQIRDDLNDFVQDASSAGKPVGSDLIKGNLTLPVIYAKNRDRELDQSIQAVLKNPEGVPPEELEQILGKVEEKDGIKEARALLERYIHRGIKALEEVPKNVHSSLLEGLLTDLQLD